MIFLGLLYFRAPASEVVLQEEEFSGGAVRKAKQFERTIER